MTRPVPALALLATTLACNWEPCADASADFTLPAPDSTAVLVVQACGADEIDLELRISLTPDQPPEDPLAIEVDDVEFYAMEDSWGSEHNFSDLAEPTDCDPGRRITVRRIDTNAAVSVSGTLVAELSAPKRKTCSAEITTLSTTAASPPPPRSPPPTVAPPTPPPRDSI